MLSSVVVGVEKFLVSAVDSAVNIFVVDFQDPLNHLWIVVDDELVVGGIGKSLNRGVYLYSDVLLASVVRNFPDQFVHYGIQSGLGGVLLESVVRYRCVLVSKVELLVDPVMGFF